MRARARQRRVARTAGWRPGAGCGRRGLPALRLPQRYRPGLSRGGEGEGRRGGATHSLPCSPAICSAGFFTPTASRARGRRDRLQRPSGKWMRAGVKPSSKGTACNRFNGHPGNGMRAGPRNASFSRPLKVSLPLTAAHRFLARGWTADRLSVRLRNPVADFAFSHHPVLAHLLQGRLPSRNPGDGE